MTALPQRIRLQIADGQDLGVRQSPVHWEIARMLLDFVQPPDADRPAPSKDEMVRQWYRATAAWMQQVSEHETVHLDRGRELFPTDPDLAFLAACEHETFASAAIQAAMRTSVAPTGFSFAILNDRGEMKDAETLFRRALSLRPEFPEARLRLGRVLGLLGHHEEAAKELAQAQAEVGDDATLPYFAALFLGAEEEASGRYDSARESYERAAAIEPMAQSPWLALAQLARRRGDRASALHALVSAGFLSPMPGGRYGRADLVTGLMTWFWWSRGDVSWIATLVFIHLFSGADAFVSSQLWDLPTQIELRVLPRGIGVDAKVPFR